ncbi:hypothetical protein [Bacillus paramycoides]|uniref:hypothetical protein n=1 Tax=Bacillus paramycoides TaxID=2026194 RepID=UPI003CFFDB56
MELTKLEKAIVIGAFAELLGIEELSHRVDKHTLERLDEEGKKIVYNLTSTQMHEAGTSVINKIIKSLIEDN